MFQVNLETLQSEHLNTLYVLQSERAVCPSSLERKGMCHPRFGAQGAGLCKNAI